MITHELRVLIRKEWRQLLRSKSALLTALLLPTFLLVVIPSLMLLGFGAGGTGEVGQIPSGVPLPPAMREIGDDPKV